MKGHETDRFWTAGRQALARATQARAEVESRTDRPPRLGDLLLFAETASLGVLWTVVEAEAPAGTFLLAAVDANPLTGSQDIVVPASSSCGALSVRCGITVRCDRVRIEAARRVGALESEIVDRILGQRTASTVSLFEDQSGEEPKVRDWMRCLVQAQELLGSQF